MDERVIGRFFGFPLDTIRGAAVLAWLLTGRGKGIRIDEEPAGARFRYRIVEVG